VESDLRSRENMWTTDLASAKLQGASTFKYSIIYAFLPMFSALKYYKFAQNSKLRLSVEKELDI
jgi:hypothetical protein